MTKSELIDLVAAKLAHLNAKDVELAINAILDTMVIALAQNQRIEIRGFGGFSTVHCPARLARNPKTGGTVSVESRRVIRFKTSKELSQ